MFISLCLKPRAEWPLLLPLLDHLYVRVFPCVIRHVLRSIYRMCAVDENAYLAGVGIYLVNRRHS